MKLSLLLALLQMSMIAAVLAGKKDKDGDDIDSDFCEDLDCDEDEAGDCKLICDSSAYCMWDEDGENDEGVLCSLLDSDMNCCILNFEFTTTESSEDIASTDDDSDDDSEDDSELSVTDASDEDDSDLETTDDDDDDDDDSDEHDASSEDETPSPTVLIGGPSGCTGEGCSTTTTSYGETTSTTSVKTWTKNPTSIKTKNPTSVKTKKPTSVKTWTKNPTSIKTKNPTSVKTKNPTAVKTKKPTSAKTYTKAPTSVKTKNPTSLKTKTPSAKTWSKSKKSGLTSDAKCNSKFPSSHPINRVKTGGRKCPTPRPTPAPTFGTLSGCRSGRCGPSSAVRKSLTNADKWSIVHPSYQGIQGELLWQIYYGDFAIDEKFAEFRQQNNWDLQDVREIIDSDAAYQVYLVVEENSEERENFNAGSAATSDFASNYALWAIVVAAILIGFGLWWKGRQSAKNASEISPLIAHDEERQALQSYDTATN